MVLTFCFFLGYMSFQVCLEIKRSVAYVLVTCMRDSVACSRQTNPGVDCCSLAVWYRNCQYHTFSIK